MAARQKQAGALTEKEHPIIKALLGRKWRNQDIQKLVNTGRDATINSARITEVKQDKSMNPASDKEVDFFILRKESYNPKTGLNRYDDERHIRAREAMILAVQNFNSPSLTFKTEQFSVQAVIAWTYLLHELYKRKDVEIRKPNGQYMSLSKMIERDDAPISDGMKNNIKSIIEIRNEVCHGLLGTADQNYFSLFHACCLNFDKILCKEFGNRVSLTKDLSLALQFSKLDFDQGTRPHPYGVPENIQALDKRLNENLTKDQQDDLEYQFRVIYVLIKAPKSKAHIQFVKPNLAEGRAIHNVLERHIIADDHYPYKPQKAANLIAEKSGKKFTIHNHTQAYKKYKARPKKDSQNRLETNKDWCIYHPAHNDYTYSQKWIDFIVKEISTEEGYWSIKSFIIL